MHLTPDQGMEALQASGKLFLKLFAHGSLEIEIYKPDRHDLQQPHDRDEIYVVISGHGEFINGDDTVIFHPGDVLFVPAGVVHRFVHFTEDFATWVFFYGPAGGE